MQAFEFSLANRNATLSQIEQNYFDLIIIGGGITGAGIALDAASRGLKVALFEKQDFAAGTSSRSTKLIHGGLRYLKQLEFGLVREVGKERDILHRNAPHLVIPQKMLLPIVEDGSLGELSTSLGLWVYDRVAGVKKPERRKMLSKEETQEAEPLLNKKGLEGGGLYHEYQTDDARLTMEVMKAATTYGAACYNYAEVSGFLYNGDMLSGVEVRDLLNEEKACKVRAKCVLNATGPWVDEVRVIDRPDTKKQLLVTKGVHVVVDYEKLPLQQAAYFDVGDGRMIFAIPRQGITYIGTTDTVYTDNFERPQVDEHDACYLLEAVNQMFPNQKLKLTDIISTWAGLRPLIYEEDKAPSELSRKDEIFYADSGLISIAGGKLTGYRKMAERAVEAVLEQIGDTDEGKEDCVTAKIKLGGESLESSEGVQAFIDKIVVEYSLSEKSAYALVSKYGAQTVSILAFYGEMKIEADEAVKLILAELRYCIENEMCTSLCDFLIRRSGRLYFELPHIQQLLPDVLPHLTTYLGWTDAQIVSDLEEWQKEAKGVKVKRVSG